MPAKEYQILPISNTTNIKSGKSTHWKFDICHLTLDIPCFSRAGFTLVELMVVISIIAILAAIGLTVYSQAQQSARDAKRIGDLGETQKALEQYYAIHVGDPAGGYPVGAGVAVSALGSISSYFQNQTAPDDPNPALSGSNYKYFSCGAVPTQYIVCAKLENCGSKCNMSAFPTPDGCVATGVPAAGNAYLCLKSLSN